MQLFTDLMVRKLIGVNEAGRPIGQYHHKATLSDADVDVVLELRFVWRLTYPDIASKFDDVPGGVSVHTIRDICRGRRRAQTVRKFVVRG